MILQLNILQSMIKNNTQYIYLYTRNEYYLLFSDGSLIIFIFYEEELYLMNK